MTALVCLAMDDGAKRIDQTVFSKIGPLDWEKMVKCAFSRTNAELTSQKLCMNTSYGWLWGTSMNANRA